MRAYVDYARAVPRAAGQARANLRTPMPRTYAELGEMSFNGMASYFEADVPAVFAEVGDADLQAEFRQLRFDRIFPLGAWLQDQPWNVRWVQWFLLYALFPFILVKSTQSLEQAAWGFGIYFAVTWLIVLSLCMRPEKVNPELMVAVWVITAILGVVAGWMRAEAVSEARADRRAEAEMAAIRARERRLAERLAEERREIVP